MKPDESLSKYAFLVLLRSRVDAIGTQQRAAKLLKVSGAYLSDVLHERREPGPRLLSALGYQKVVLYRRTETP